MEQILVPNKTFTLYATGVRTFIHLKNEDVPRIKDRLKFGQTVVLVNKQTGETLEQTFWFIHTFSEIPSVCFLMFRWDKTDELFMKRRVHARSFKDGASEVEHLPYFSLSQRYLRHMLAALSALFFIENRNAVTSGTSFCIDNGEGKCSERYLVVDNLRILRHNDEWFEVYSVFPVSFFHLS